MLRVSDAIEPPKVEETSMTKPQPSEIWSAAITSSCFAGAHRAREEVLNVAHAIHGLGLGGAQKVISALVAGRRQSDLRYFVYSCEDGVHRREIEDGGALVRIVPRVLPKFDPLWVWRLGAAMSEDDIDIVHSHLFGDSLHASFAARSRGRLPVVMTLHIGPSGWRGMQRRIYPWLLSRCHRAVACAESVQREVLSAHPAATRVMETIPNGIPAQPVACPGAARHAELRARLGLDPEVLVVAGVGRLVEQKGFRYLIEAFSRICQERDDLRLVLLGSGELRRDLERQAREGGVEAQVIFAGFRDDVAELLPVLDVVVFSSLFEGLPIALLETMAAGRCLVTTDIPALLDAVRRDREAVVVPIADSSRLAEAIARLADDEPLRQRLGAAARERFESRFTADAMVECYEALYRSVVADAI